MQSCPQHLQISCNSMVITVRVSSKSFMIKIILSDGKPVVNIGRAASHEHLRPPWFMINCSILAYIGGVYWPVSTDAGRPYSPTRKEPEMNIEIRDAALEARIKKQLQATGSATVEEVLLRLLETQEEQDRWLSENREAINAKIRRGISQLDRGEGIPEDHLDAHLSDLKAKPE